MYKLICYNLSKSNRSLTNFTKTYRRVAQNFENKERIHSNNEKFGSETDLQNTEKDVEIMEVAETIEEESFAPKTSKSYTSFFNKKMGIKSNDSILCADHYLQITKLPTCSTHTIKLFHSHHGEEENHVTPKKKLFKNKEAMDMYRSAIQQCMKIRGKKHMFNKYSRDANSGSWSIRAASWDKKKWPLQTRSEVQMLKPKVPGKLEVEVKPHFVYVYPEEKHKDMRREAFLATKKVRARMLHEMNHELIRKKFKITYPTHIIRHKLANNKPRRIKQMTSLNAEEVNEHMRRSTARSADMTKSQYPAVQNPKMYKAREKPPIPYNEAIRKEEAEWQDIIKQHPVVEKASRRAKMAMNKIYNKLLSAQRYKDSLKKEKTVEERAPKIMQHPAASAKTFKVTVKYPKRFYVERNNSYDIEKICIKSNETKFNDYNAEASRKATGPEKESNIFKKLFLKPTQLEAEKKPQDKKMISVIKLRDSNIAKEAQGYNRIEEKGKEGTQEYLKPKSPAGSYMVDMGHSLKQTRPAESVKGCTEKSLKRKDSVDGIKEVEPSLYSKNTAESLKEKTEQSLKPRALAGYFKEMKTSLKIPESTKHVEQFLKPTKPTESKEDMKQSLKAKDPAESLKKEEVRPPLKRKGPEENFMKESEQSPSSKGQSEIIKKAAEQFLNSKGLRESITEEVKQPLKQKCSEGSFRKEVEQSLSLKGPAKSDMGEVKQPLKRKSRVERFKEKVEQSLSPKGSTESIMQRMKRSLKWKSPAKSFKKEEEQSLSSKGPTENIMEETRQPLKWKRSVESFKKEAEQSLSSKGPKENIMEVKRSPTWNSPAKSFKKVPEQSLNSKGSTHSIKEKVEWPLKWNSPAESLKKEGEGLLKSEDQAGSKLESTTRSNNEMEQSLKQKGAAESLADYVKKLKQLKEQTAIDNIKKHAVSEMMRNLEEPANEKMLKQEVAQHTKTEDIKRTDDNLMIKISTIIDPIKKKHASLEKLGNQNQEEIKNEEEPIKRIGRYKPNGSKSDALEIELPPGTTKKPGKHLKSTNCKTIKPKIPVNKKLPTIIKYSVINLAKSKEKQTQNEEIMRQDTPRSQTPHKQDEKLSELNHTAEEQADEIDELEKLAKEKNKLERLKKIMSIYQVRGASMSKLENEIETIKNDLVTKQMAMIRITRRKRRNGQKQKENIAAPKQNTKVGQPHTPTQIKDEGQNRRLTAHIYDEKRTKEKNELQKSTTLIPDKVLNKIEDKKQSRKIKVRTHSEGSMDKFFYKKDPIKEQTSLSFTEIYKADNGQPQEIMETDKSLMDKKAGLQKQENPDLTQEEDEEFYPRRIFKMGKPTEEEKRKPCKTVVLGKRMKKARNKKVTSKLAKQKVDSLVPQEGSSFKRLEEKGPSAHKLTIKTTETEPQVGAKDPQEKEFIVQKIDFPGRLKLQKNYEQLKEAGRHITKTLIQEEAESKVEMDKKQGNNRPSIRRDKPEPESKEKSKKEKPKTKKDMVLPSKGQNDPQMRHPDLDKETQDKKLESLIKGSEQNTIYTTQDKYGIVSLERFKRCQSLSDLAEEQKAIMLNEINEKLALKPNTNLQKVEGSGKPNDGKDEVKSTANVLCSKETNKQVHEAAGRKEAVKDLSYKVDNKQSEKKDGNLPSATTVKEDAAYTSVNDTEVAKSCPSFHGITRRTKEETHRTKTDEEGMNGYDKMSLTSKNDVKVETDTPITKVDIKQPVTEEKDKLRKMVQAAAKQKTENETKQSLQTGKTSLARKNIARGDAEQTKSRPLTRDDRHETIAAEQDQKTESRHSIKQDKYETLLPKRKSSLQAATKAASPSNKSRHSVQGDKYETILPTRKTSLYATTKPGSPKNKSRHSIKGDMYKTMLPTHKNNQRVAAKQTMAKDKSQSSIKMDRIRYNTIPSRRRNSLLTAKQTNVKDEYKQSKESEGYGSKSIVWTKKLIEKEELSTKMQKEGEGNQFPNLKIRPYGNEYKGDKDVQQTGDKSDPDNSKNMTIHLTMTGGRKRIEGQESLKSETVSSLAKEKEIDAAKLVKSNIEEIKATELEQSMEATPRSTDIMTEFSDKISRKSRRGRVGDDVALSETENKETGSPIVGPKEIETSKFSDKVLKKFKQVRFENVFPEKENTVTGSQVTDAEGIKTTELERDEQALVGSSETRELPDNMFKKSRRAIKNAARTSQVTDAEEIKAAKSEQFVGTTLRSSDITTAFSDNIFRKSRRGRFEDDVAFSQIENKPIRSQHTDLNEIKAKKSEWSGGVPAESGQKITQSSDKIFRKSRIGRFEDDVLFTEKENEPPRSQMHTDAKEIKVTKSDSSLGHVAKLSEILMRYPKKYFGKTRNAKIDDEIVGKKTEDQRNCAEQSLTVQTTVTSRKVHKNEERKSHPIPSISRHNAKLSSEDRIREKPGYAQIMANIQKRERSIPVEKQRPSTKDVSIACFKIDDSDSEGQDVPELKQEYTKRDNSLRFMEKEMKQVETEPHLESDKNIIINRPISSGHRYKTDTRRDEKAGSQLDYVKEQNKISAVVSVPADRPATAALSKNKSELEKKLILTHNTKVEGTLKSHKEILEKNMKNTHLLKNKTQLEMTNVYVGRATDNLNTVDSSCGIQLSQSLPALTTKKKDTSRDKPGKKSKVIVRPNRDYQKLISNSLISKSNDIANSSSKLLIKQMSNALAKLKIDELSKSTKYDSITSKDIRSTTPTAQKKLFLDNFTQEKPERDNTILTNVMKFFEKSEKHTDRPGVPKATKINEKASRKEESTEKVINEKGKRISSPLPIRTKQDNLHETANLKVKCEVAKVPTVQDSTNKIMLKITGDTWKNQDDMNHKQTAKITNSRTVWPKSCNYDIYRVNTATYVPKKTRHINIYGNIGEYPKKTVEESATEIIKKPMKTDLPKKEEQKKPPPKCLRKPSSKKNTKISEKPTEAYSPKNQKRRKVYGCLDLRTSRPIRNFKATISTLYISDTEVNKTAHKSKKITKTTSRLKHTPSRKKKSAHQMKQKTGPLKSKYSLQNYANRVSTPPKRIASPSSANTTPPLTNEISSFIQLKLMNRRCRRQLQLQNNVTSPKLESPTISNRDNRVPKKEVLSFAQMKLTHKPGTEPLHWQHRLIKQITATNSPYLSQCNGSNSNRLKSAGVPRNRRSRKNYPLEVIVEKKEETEEPSVENLNCFERQGSQSTTVIYANSNMQRDLRTSFYKHIIDNQLATEFSKYLMEQRYNPRNWPPYFLNDSSKHKEPAPVNLKYFTTSTNTQSQIESKGKTNEINDVEKTNLTLSEKQKSSVSTYKQNSGEAQDNMAVKCLYQKSSRDQETTAMLVPSDSKYFIEKTKVAPRIETAGKININEVEKTNRIPSGNPKVLDFIGNQNLGKPQNNTTVNKEVTGSKYKEQCDQELTRVPAPLHTAFHVETEGKTNIKNVIYPTPSENPKIVISIERQSPERTKCQTTVSEGSYKEENRQGTTHTLAPLGTKYAPSTTVLKAETTGKSETINNVVKVNPTPSENPKIFISIDGHSPEKTKCQETVNEVKGSYKEESRQGTTHILALLGTKHATSRTELKTETIGKSKTINIVEEANPTPSENPKILISIDRQSPERTKCQTTVNEVKSSYKEEKRQGTTLKPETMGKFKTINNVEKANPTPSENRKIVVFIGKQNSKIRCDLTAKKKVTALKGKGQSDQVITQTLAPLDIKFSTKREKAVQHVGTIEKTKDGERTNLTLSENPKIVVLIGNQNSEKMQDKTTVKREVKGSESKETIRALAPLDSKYLMGKKTASQVETDGKTNNRNDVEKSNSTLLLKTSKSSVLIDKLSSKKTQCEMAVNEKIKESKHKESNTTRALAPLDSRYFIMSGKVTPQSETEEKTNINKVKKMKLIQSENPNNFHFKGNRNSEQIMDKMAINKDAKGSNYKETTRAVAPLDSNYFLMSGKTALQVETGRKTNNINDVVGTNPTRSEISRIPVFIGKPNSKKIQCKTVVKGSKYKELNGCDTPRALARLDPKNLIISGKAAQQIETAGKANMNNVKKTKSTPSENQISTESAVKENSGKKQCETIVNEKVKGSKYKELNDHETTRAHAFAVKDNSEQKPCETIVNKQVKGFKYEEEETTHATTSLDPKFIITSGKAAPKVETKGKTILNNMEKMNSTPPENPKSTTSTVKQNFEEVQDEMDDKEVGASITEVVEQVCRGTVILSFSPVMTTSFNPRENDTQVTTAKINEIFPENYKMEKIGKFNKNLLKHMRTNSDISMTNSSKRKYIGNLSVTSITEPGKRDEQGSGVKLMSKERDHHRDELQPVPSDKVHPVTIEKTIPNRYKMEKAPEPKRVVWGCDKICLPLKSLSEVALNRPIDIDTTLNNPIGNKYYKVQKHFPDKSTRYKKIRIANIIVKRPKKSLYEHFLQPSKPNMDKNEKSRIELKDLQLEAEKAQMMELRFELMRKLHNQFRSMYGANTNNIKGNFEGVLKHYKQVIGNDKKMSEERPKKKGVTKCVSDLFKLDTKQKPSFHNVSVYYSKILKMDKDCNVNMDLHFKKKIKNNTEILLEKLGQQDAHSGKKEHNKPSPDLADDNTNDKNKSNEKEPPPK